MVKFVKHMQMADAKSSASGSDVEVELESDDDMPLAKKKQKGSRYDLCQQCLPSVMDSRRYGDCHSWPTGI